MDMCHGVQDWLTIALCRITLLDDCHTSLSVIHCSIIIKTSLDINSRLQYVGYCNKSNRLQFLD